MTQKKAFLVGNEMSKGDRIRLQLKLDEHWIDGRVSQDNFASKVFYTIDDDILGNNCYETNGACVVEVNQNGSLFGLQDLELFLSKIFLLEKGRTSLASRLTYKKDNDSYRILAQELMPCPTQFMK